jgi:hypothetical protein
MLLFFIASCTKENPPGGSVTPNLNQEEMYFVAANWERDGDGNFTSILNGVLRHMYVATIKVYLVTDLDETLISDGAINFMSGSLWAIRSDPDLKVKYRPNIHDTGIPFKKLSIKVVIE